MVTPRTSLLRSSASPGFMSRPRLASLASITSLVTPTRLATRTRPKLRSAWVWSWNDPGKPKRSQVKGDKTVDQDQKRERCQSDITGTCTGVADGVFMTDLG